MQLTELVDWKPWVFGIGGSLVATALVGVMVRFRKRWKDVEGRLLLLQDEKERSDRLSDDLSAKLKAISERLIAYEARLPETVWEKAKADWNNDNKSKANDIVADWLDREGDTISQLLLYRAIWTQKHACQHLRQIGLLVAEAYATAAVTLWPQNREAVDLRDDLAGYSKNEGNICSTPLTMALTQFDGEAEAFFEHDPVAAKMAEQEAQLLYLRGYYHLALSMNEFSLNLRTKSSGEGAAETLRGKRSRAYLLIEAGRADNALPIALYVANSFAVNPAFGPKHFDTLYSFVVVALVLEELGSEDEALKHVQALDKVISTHPLPDPQIIHAVDFLLARLYYKLGRFEEALPKAQAVKQTLVDNPQLDSSHQNVIVVGQLTVKILLEAVINFIPLFTFG